MSSLTRDAAIARASRISGVSYAVELNLDTNDRYFRSVTRLRFTVADRAAEPVFVDVAPRRLHGARLDGRDLDVTGFDPASRRLVVDDEATPLAPGEHELVVDAEMAYSHDGEGLVRHVDPADGRVYLYAMSFLDAAPRWFACFDQPDLKAPLALDVRCPAGWLVAGNGPAGEVSPGRWTIPAGPPLATYFATLVAGEYHAVRDTHDGIPLTLLARRSLAEPLEQDAAELFTIMKHCFDELHRLFDVRYAWPELALAFAPAFNAGAMENPGCITVRDDYVFRSRVTRAQREARAVTVAHEMAHLWFGDLVTMRWWDDLWLNESFAEYLGQRVTGDQAWAAFGIERKSWGYRADRRPSTHPVAGNGAADAAAALAAFDGISYAKGASVLRQLAAHLGDDAFLAGLRAHIAGHAHGNAEFADLIGAWNDTGHDITGFADTWLRTTGVDTLRVVGGELLRSSPGAARPHAIALASFDTDGQEVGRTRVAVDADRVSHGLPPAELVLPDAGDETWAKIALDDASWGRLPDVLPRLADPLARVVVWNSLILAVADAELDPVLASAIVRAALPGEPHDAVLAVVGRWATQTLLGTCVDAAVAAGESAALGDAMRARADAAEPGSGRQLAVARIAVAATRDARVLRSWLAGDVPAGLVVDAEFRWLLLRALAALGSLGEGELDAEAAADATTQGAVHAAWCRAARPDAASKAQVWRTITSDPDVANYELYALAEGFWRPGQDAVTAPYVPRYVDTLPAMTALRSGWVAEQVARLAFPWTAVSPDTLAGADSLLAAELPAGVRKSVVDAADDLRRALAVRERFGN